MSHFSVLVLGNDVDFQLAPFHEFESTGEVDEFVQDINITKKVIADYVKANEKNPSNEELIAYWRSEHGSDMRVLRDGALPDYHNKDIWGYARANADGSVELFNRTNPNSKWDWYDKAGGRWGSEYFLLKDGTRASSACKGDIDFKGICQPLAIKAASIYDKVQALYTQFPNTLTMAEIQHSFMSLPQHEQVRIYQKQELMQRARNDSDLKWVSVADIKACSRQQYIRQYVFDFASTFAVVENRNWHEGAEMGWWGVTRNPKDARQWRREWLHIINSASDDTLFTIVDCHI